MRAKAMRPVTSAGNTMPQITRFTTVTDTDLLSARTRTASTAPIIKTALPSARDRARPGRQPRRVRPAATPRAAPEALDPVGDLVVGDHAMPVDPDPPRDPAAVVGDGEVRDPVVDRALHHPEEPQDRRHPAQRGGRVERPVVAHEDHDAVVGRAEAAPREIQAVVVDVRAAPAPAGGVEPALRAAVGDR